MSAPAPFILTRALKRTAHQVYELALGTRRCLLIVAPSGMGKSAFFRWACEKLAWPYPLEYYWEHLQDAETTAPGLGGTYTVPQGLAFAERIGLVTDATRERATALFTKRFDYYVERGTIAGPELCRWLTWLAPQLGQPRPDAMQVLSLRGISADDRPATRFPLLITGAITDNPRSITMKLYEAIRPEVARGRVYYRAARVEELLRKFPTVVLVDEVDTMSVEAIRTVQQICEAADTPFCLAGTEQLVGRLMRDPRLRPIATRIELRANLGTVTAGDLQRAFPHYASDTILAVWAASGKNWRIAAHIIQGLEELRRERPGGRLGKRAVAAVAEQVLAARALQLGAEDLEEAATLTGATLPAVAAQARPVRRAAQAVG